jgi:hypothetical protein
LKATYKSGSNREDFNTTELRKELLVSVKSVQLFSSAVKDDIQEIHKVCRFSKTPIRGPSFEMQSWTTLLRAVF